MPHVINGIGTWYYGKNHRHQLRNVCSSCHNFGDLESYDTTLYFVFFFVPLIPLKGVRVLDSCPSCNRHRVVPLREWNRVKEESTSDVRDRIGLNPTDRDTLIEGLQVAGYFQDEALFQDVSEAVTARRGNDAELLDYYGDVNSYFARHNAAEEAYRDSITVEDNPVVREKLGLSLLRQGDPDLASGYFRHILETADNEKAWMYYQLVVAYQARGLHTDALATLDEVETAFPVVVTDKDWKKLRKTSVKDAGRNRPVGKSAMLESRTAGTHTGSRLGSLLPKLVLPALLIAYGTWHTFSALTLAGGRPMTLINGSPKQYTVLINGTPYPLAPGQPTSVELPEGPLKIAPGDGAAAVEPTEVAYHCSFFARPYDSTKLVINPDRMAVLAKEVTVYADNPPESPPPLLETGGTLYQYTNIDYFFQAFPDKIPVKRGNKITKTQLSLVPVTTSEQRLRALLAAKPGEAELTAYARHWVAADPDDSIAIVWMCATLPVQDSLAILESRLGDRPLRVDWHRMYQTTAERAGTLRAELQQRYEKLVAETDRNPQALYLLARLADRDEALKLLHEAVATGLPAEYAHYALGYRSLCEGDFKNAVTEMLQAGKLLDQIGYRETLNDALLAAGPYAELKKRYATQGVSGLMGLARIAARSEGQIGIELAENAVLAQLPPTGPSWQLAQSAFAADHAAVTGNVAGYLAAVQATPQLDSLAAKLLRHESPDVDEVKTLTETGLILLAAPPAERPHAKAAFLAALQVGDRDEKMLAERLTQGGPGIVEAMRTALVLPREKRVFAAVASQLFPAEREKLLKLSKQMDFDRDGVSLLLGELTKR